MIATPHASLFGWFDLGFGRGGDLTSWVVLAGVVAFAIWLFLRR